MSANIMNTEERNQYVQEMESTKAKYYEEHSKNRFFKNSRQIRKTKKTIENKIKSWKPDKPTNTLKS